MHPVLEAIDSKPTVDGWYYLWLRYVNGFDPTRHCAVSLISTRSRRINMGMRTNHPVVLDEARSRHIYLCGGAQKGGWIANLHLAMEPAPGETAFIVASTGTVFRVRNARRLEIPALPAGFDGRGPEFTTCRNWQFGVAYYGLRPTHQASAGLGRPSGHSATSGRTRAGSRPRPRLR